MSKKFYLAEETNQTFWQLASIQSAAQGFPAILVGGQIAAEYGNGTALISIFIANLFSWLIGLAIISMTIQSRKNAIENVRSYLGNLGGIFAALVLIIAFLNWYIIQINLATESIELFFKQKNVVLDNGMIIRIGASLGLLIALLAMGGIRLIKWLAVCCLPFFTIYVIFLFFHSTNVVLFNGTWGFSFSAVVLIMIITLPGYINLPTFFRHSKSRSDSFLALTIFTLFSIFFESFSIFIGINSVSEFVKMNSPNIELVMLATFFIILSLLCVNLVNIYFASAGWEMIIPHIWSAKEYAIVGLLGTAAYTFLQVSKPMIFLEHAAESFISSLGIVLLMTFLMKIIVKHRLRTMEKTISGICWFIGCATSLYLLIYSDKQPSQVLIAGILASTISFLIVIFVEETNWSLKSVASNYLREKNGK